MYRFLKIIVPVVLRIFYRRIKVHGKQNLEHEGPMIIVSNHPNTLMDPVIVASVVKPQIGFLGKATLFSNKLAARFLHYFNVIPVYRKIDVAITGTMDNSQSFEKCYEYIEQGGTLLIFPEGVSYPDKRLRELKTGTARIGFEVEMRNGFEAGVKILPISLNYSDPSRFRTLVTVNITPAIHLKEYEEEYKNDPVATVQSVTDRIKRRLEQEMIIIDDKEEEELLKKVNTIYGSRLLETLPEVKDRKSRFRVIQAIGSAINWLKKTDPDRFAKAKKEVDLYYDLIDRIKLRHGFVSSRFQQWNSALLTVIYFLYLVVFFPIYLFGVITNYLPYLIPGKVAAKLTHEIEFWSSIMMVVGMVLFPLFWTVEIVTFHIFLGHIKWATLIFGLMLPVSGLVALDYWLRLHRFIGLIRLWRLGGKKGDLFERLKERKQNLIEMLEGIRKDYESRRNPG